MSKSSRSIELIGIILLSGLAGYGAWDSLVLDQTAPSSTAIQLENPAVKIQPDLAWYSRGGMITGGFVKATAQDDWPLWMQALLSGRPGVARAELERCDLYKVPDAFLAATIQNLEANRIFTGRILRQATAIGYTARADVWQPAKTSYQIAYLKARGLPTDDDLTTSRILTQMAYQNQFGLIREVMSNAKWPAATLQSMLRMVDMQERRITPTPEAVMNAARPASERLTALLLLKHPAEPEKLLASLRGTDVLDLAVLHGVTDGWIPLESHLVDDAIRMKKKPDENSLWFLIRPEERVSDLLWMRAMEALRNGENQQAVAYAKTILADYPKSWYAGHAAYLITDFEPKIPSPLDLGLRVPGDITFFNSPLVRVNLKKTEQIWSDRYQAWANLNRFDLILADVDPVKEPDVFLRAASLAGQQDLVIRFQYVEKNCSPVSAPYLFPIFLRPMVERLIREEGLEGRVDAAFVLAMIKNESGFQPSAQSGANAFGIMQLLKPTFFHMSPGANILDPESNIRAGLRYYRTVIRTAQLESLPEDARHLYILAGYHAGEGRARRWRLENETKLNGHVTPTDMLLRVESIPITSTRHYILRVLGDRDLFRFYFSNI